MKDCYNGGTCRNEDLIEDLQAENTRCRAVIEAVEFVPDFLGNSRYCPWCLVVDDHAADCDRQAALATTEEG